MIYYVIFWTLAVLAFLEVFTKRDNSNGRIKKFIIFLIANALVFFAGLREGVGIDWRSYYQDYTLVKSGAMSVINTSIEPGYSLINYISPSFRWLLIVMAILSVGIRFKAFEKNQLGCILLAIFFYYSTDFIFYDMGIMRQGLSMSICLLSMPLIEKRDKKFFIYIVFGALFHISALFFVLMWFISNKEYSRKYYYAWVGIAVIFFLGEISYTEIAGKIINDIGGAYLEHKFNKYLTYSQVDLTIPFIRRIIFLVLFIEAFKRKSFRISNFVIPERNKTELTWLHINGYFLSVVTFGIFTPLFSSVTGRMTAMFYTLYIFVYCDMFEDRKQIWINIIWFVMFLFLAFETFNGSVNNVNGNYLPYLWGW